MLYYYSNQSLQQDLQVGALNEVLSFLSRRYEMSDSPPDIIRPNDMVFVQSWRLHEGPIRVVGGRVCALFVDDFARDIYGALHTWYMSNAGPMHRGLNPSCQGLIKASNSIRNQLFFSTDRVALNQATVGAIKYLYAAGYPHDMQGTPTVCCAETPDFRVMPVEPYKNCWPEYTPDIINYTWDKFFEERRVSVSIIA